MAPTFPHLATDLLAAIEKPSRYLGGEVGQTRKDLTTVETKVALCYPDLYEIGMSHIGLKILASILHQDDRVACERVYAPAPDMEHELRTRGLPLCTLENGLPLRQLDVLGFTLQYELSYSNVLTVLDLGGIPLFSADRSREHPLVIAGGPCAFNPEPLAPFLDAVCLGDGEETILAVLEVHRRWKASGARREELLWALTEVTGVYVPSLYTPRYEGDRLVAVEAAPGLPPRVRKAILLDLDAAPYFDKTPVPFMQVVHDRVGVEIQRGCMRGCRFCQAGYVYRPERQRSPDRVRQLVRDGLRETGQEEFSLLSLSAGDYGCMEKLLSSLMDEHEGRRTGISLPSMRLETLSPGIMEQIDRVRKTSFTVAPEAASDRLRAVINKVIDEDVLIEMVGEVFSRGWSAMKFYFMIGLPTEQDEDLDAMISLGARCLYRARKFKRDANITISASTFVPKSHTPFQWATQITLPQIHHKQSFLRERLGRAKLGFRYHSDRSSVMEGIFSRGDRRTAAALLAAWKKGARLDGWQEHLNEGAWTEAFAETGIDPAFYNQRRREPDEVFPWYAIDIGMKPEWLWEDWMDALEAGFVPDCTQEPCYDCGVCDHEVVHNRVFEKPDEAAVHRARKPWGGSRKLHDPQFVAMPRPPGKKGTNVTDASPPQGLAPGSAPARAARAHHVPREMAAAAPPVNRHDKKSVVPTLADGRPDWTDIIDTRLPTDQRARVLVRFGKLGNLVHLGHLEVMGAVRRALKRIDAPVLWSQGFHPQMRISFGPPLPSGMGSTAEYLEIELKKPVDVAAFGQALSGAMAVDLPILSVEEIPWAWDGIAHRMSRFAWELAVPDAARDEVRMRIAGILAGTIDASVTTKKDGEDRVSVTDIVSGLRETAPGAWVFDSPSDGPGARVREVIAALFGEIADDGRAFDVRRVAASFHLGGTRPQPLFEPSQEQHAT